MFGQEPKDNQKNDFKDAETVIGPSVMVKGNFNSTGNIVVEGVLQGGIKTAGSVYLGDHAKVTASIEAKAARLGGEITGNIKIEGRLQIVSSARLFGDIECSTLVIESGAIINGKIIMTNSLPTGKKQEKSDLPSEDK